MFFRNTKVYFQSTKVYSPSTKVYFQSTSILSNYTSILSKNKSSLWKYKNIPWRKNPKTRLLRVLFDSIDLLALFGVYAGIIFTSPGKIPLGVFRWWFKRRQQKPWGFGYDLRFVWMSWCGRWSLRLPSGSSVLKSFRKAQGKCWENPWDGGPLINPIERAPTGWFFPARVPYHRKGPPGIFLMMERIQEENWGWLHIGSKGVCHLGMSFGAHWKILTFWSEWWTYSPKTYSLRNEGLITPY